MNFKVRFIPMIAESGFTPKTFSQSGFEDNDRM